MTEDIVDRLRERSIVDHGETALMAMEAADEIERLQRALGYLIGREDLVATAGVGGEILHPRAELLDDLANEASVEIDDEEAARLVVGYENHRRHEGSNDE